MLPHCGRVGRRLLFSHLFVRPPPVVPSRGRHFVLPAGSNSWTNHRIDLPVGLNGCVKLDIFSPLHQISNRDEPRKVLVHFPPGPSLPSTISGSHDDLSLSHGSISPSTTVVTVNYRLGASRTVSVSPSETHAFPTPIHDVSTALDYLTSSSSAFNHDQNEPPVISLLGSHIGGALATMLALTEPNSIHALAAIEPMVDWVGLDEVVEQLRTMPSTFSSSLQLSQAQKYAQRQAQRGKIIERHGADNPSIIAAAEQLIKLRSKLFKTPSAYFDPFASPILFLRAPGRDTPLATTVGDRLLDDMGLSGSDSGNSDHESDAFGPYDDDWQPSTSASDSASADTRAHGGTTSPVSENETTNILQATTSPRRRKVLRRWPAVGLPDDVALPHVKISLQSGLPTPNEEARSGNPDTDNGLSALKRAQGKELCELMRRACFIGREKGFAEDRVQLQLCENKGPVARETTMQESSIKWLGQMFSKD